MSYLDQNRDNNLETQISELSKTVENLTKTVAVTANTAYATTKNLPSQLIPNLGPDPRLISPTTIYAPPRTLTQNIISGYAPAIAGYLTGGDHDPTSSTGLLHGTAGGVLGGSAGFLLGSSIPFIGGFTGKAFGLLGTALGAYMGSGAGFDALAKYAGPKLRGRYSAYSPVAIRFSEQQAAAERAEVLWDSFLETAGNTSNLALFAEAGMTLATGGLSVPGAALLFMGAHTLNGDFGLSGEVVADRISKRRLDKYLRSTRFLENNKALKKQDAFKYRDALLGAIKEASDTTYYESLGNLYLGKHEVNFKDFTDKLIDSGALTELIRRRPSVAQGKSKLELGDVKNFRKEMKDAFETILDLHKELNITIEEAAKQLAKIKNFRSLHSKESFKAAKVNFFKDITTAANSLDIAEGNVYEYMKSMQKYAGVTGIGTDASWGEVGKDIIYVSGKVYKDNPDTFPTKEGAVQTTQSIATNFINSLMKYDPKTAKRLYTHGVDLDRFKATGEVHFDMERAINYFKSTKQEKTAIDKKINSFIDRMTPDQKEKFFVHQNEYLTSMSWDKTLNAIYVSEVQSVLSNKSKVADIIKHMNTMPEYKGKVITEESEEFKKYVEDSVRLKLAKRFGFNTEQSMTIAKEVMREGYIETKNIDETKALNMNAIENAKKDYIKHRYKYGDKHTYDPKSWTQWAKLRMSDAREAVSVAYDYWFGSDEVEPYVRVKKAKEADLEMADSKILSRVREGLGEGFDRLMLQTAYNFNVFQPDSLKKVYNRFYTGKLVDGKKVTSVSNLLHFAIEPSNKLQAAVSGMSDNVQSSYLNVLGKYYDLINANQGAADSTFMLPSIKADATRKRNEAVKGALSEFKDIISKGDVTGEDLKILSTVLGYGDIKDKTDKQLSNDLQQHLDFLMSHPDKYSDLAEKLILKPGKDISGGKGLGSLTQLLDMHSTIKKRAVGLELLFDENTLYSMGGIEDNKMSDEERNVTRKRAEDIKRMARQMFANSGKTTGSLLRRLSEDDDFISQDIDNTNTPMVSRFLGTFEDVSEAIHKNKGTLAKGSADLTKFEARISKLDIGLESKLNDLKQDGLTATELQSFMREAIDKLILKVTESSDKHNKEAKLEDDVSNKSENVELSGLVSKTDRVINDLQTAIDNFAAAIQSLPGVSG